MNLDDFQKSWQSQTGVGKISLNADVLLNEIRRNQKQFRTTIFLRDVREVGVAAVLIPVFIFLGVQLHNWTNYLVAAACFIVGGYILVDRWRRRGTAPKAGDSLKNCTTASLAEIRHQIWLLKNILWWYLLPCFVPIVISMSWPILWSGGHIALRVANLAPLLGGILVVVVVYWFLYWLNQYAVRRGLAPRQQELEELLSELGAAADSDELSTKKPLGPLLLVLAVCAFAMAAHAGFKVQSGL